MTLTYKTRMKAKKRLAVLHFANFRPALGRGSYIGLVIFSYNYNSPYLIGGFMKFTQTLIAITCLSFSLVSLAAGAAQSDAYKQSDLYKTLNSIVTTSDFGNGAADIKQYDLKSFNVDKALAKDLAQVKKQFPKCGPFKIQKFRRDSIQVVKTSPDGAGDTRGAEVLTSLYDKKQILKMYTIQSNKDIDCSRIWVEVYTTDPNDANNNLLLELLYGMND